MSPEEQKPQIHHMQAKAARNALARKELSQESYAAVLRGELSLDDAKSYGRNKGPDGLPVAASRISKDEQGQLCWCGCGAWTKPGRRWLPGHDQRGKGIIARAVREGKLDELSPQLREYGEQSGKIEETRQRIAREEQRKAEEAQAKTDKQRRKEGEAEQKSNE